MLMILAPLSQLLGGSIYNPCDAATLFTLHKCSFKSFLVRSVAQVAGALSGAIIVLRFFPETASERGKALVAATTKDIDSIGGASSEFLLTYLVSLLVMATQRSSRSRFIKYWAPLVATAAALRLGARYSGPVLNPAAALSWTWFYWNQQPLTILQHVFVFWVAPIAGAVAATLTDMGMQVANSTAQKPKKTTRKTD
jgi:glycerol uptake facilitator-like aquaporin